MRFSKFALILLCLSSSLPLTVAATSSSQQDAGVTRHVDVVIPAKPIASRAQLDVYVRDTPASRSPLSWLTPAARRRFLDGLVFHGRGLGGLYLGDLDYELTREQAYTLLSLFGAQNYALGLDARSTQRRPDTGDHASTLAPAYTELSSADRQDDAADGIASIYTKHFSPLQTDAQRHDLSGPDLELLFRAAALAFRVTHRPNYVDEMRADFSELQRRHLVDRPHESELFDALILLGKSDEARALQASYPLIERGAAPVMKTASRVRRGKPSLWILNTERGKRELVRYPFNIRARAQIIVLASTSCHFSELAARAIEADPALREVFRENAQWVAPANDLTDFDAIKTWNEAHTASRLGIIHDDAELPMVQRIETPMFYFLDHGRVVDTVVGWPEGGNIDALRRGLRMIDL